MIGKDLDCFRTDDIDIKAERHQNGYSDIPVRNLWIFAGNNYCESTSCRSIIAFMLIN
jgi:hypothetical protein